MPVQLQTERDSFDLWINYVLTAGAQNAQPSEHVWQRVAGAARAAQAWEARFNLNRWPGGSIFSTWSIGWEEHRRDVDALHLARIGWWLFNLRPVAYA